MVFTSASTNLVPGDTSKLVGVFVKDLQTGAVVRASTSSDGSAGRRLKGRTLELVSSPTISADGSTVAFTGQIGLNGVGPFESQRKQVWLKNLDSGKTTLVSTGADDEPGDGDSRVAVLSGEGRTVAFETTGPLSGARFSGIVVRNLRGGGVRPLHELATSVPKGVTLLEFAVQQSQFQLPLALSHDGSKLVLSTRDQIARADRNSRGDVYRIGLRGGSVTWVSTRTSGAPANGESHAASISADGSRVAFTSDASNLVARDSGGNRDAFVKDLRTGRIWRVSENARGTGGTASSVPTSLSANGRWVAFNGRAKNLAPGDTNKATDVYVSRI